MKVYSLILMTQHRRLQNVFGKIFRDSFENFEFCFFKALSRVLHISSFTQGSSTFQSGIRWKVVDVVDVDDADDDGQNTSGELESLVIREGPITHFGLSLHQFGGEGVQATNGEEGIQWIPCEEIEGNKLGEKKLGEYIVDQMKEHMD